MAMAFTRIRKNSSMGEVMRAAKLIVWDEVTMAHKAGIEALDRSLRDIRDCDRVFGGLTVLLIGDFQQILPVVKKGTPADEIKACAKSSFLWCKVRQLTLRRNMRAHLTGNPNAGRWSAKLAQLGHGNLPTNGDGEIDLRELGVNVVHSADELQAKVYPNFENNFRKAEWLRDRTILAPRNDVVDSINARLMAK